MAEIVNLLVDAGRTEGKTMGKTKTRAFGTGKREGHDASVFYGRQIFGAVAAPAELNSAAYEAGTLGEWANRIYCASSTRMEAIPDASVGLAFTSPPYCVGKDYDEDMTMEQYLTLIEEVGREVLRVLLPGGRYVINIANLGRKPYIPLHSFFYEIHQRLGFLPMGEIIWRKGKGASGSCAWGSWKSAKAPRLRDLHEYLLVFSKGRFDRPDRGVSDIQRDEFMQSTLSVWEIAAESAKRVGHPAPFPVALAERVIRLYSYVGDVVIDPFAGSGTTCVAASRNGRHWVGYDVNADYCELARRRVGEGK